MKKIIITLLLSIVCGNGIFAQMAAAQPIVWDIEKKVEVNISQGSLWSILNNDEKLKEYSNGYLKSVSMSNENPVIIERVFSDGSNRTEEIVQTNNQYKFMVIKINSEFLPKGVKKAEIAIFTSELPIGRSGVSWNAKIDGKKSGKQLLTKQLIAEFNSYISGFGRITAAVKN